MNPLPTVTVDAMESLNPFVREREVHDGVCRGELARELAIVLKVGIIIQLFGKDDDIRKRVCIPC